MQRNIKPKMSLKALQELQRMASSQAGAKVCANVSKENDILSQNTSKTHHAILHICILPHEISITFVSD